MPRATENTVLVKCKWSSIVKPRAVLETRWLFSGSVFSGYCKRQIEQMSLRYLYNHHSFVVY